MVEHAAQHSVVFLDTFHIASLSFDAVVTAQGLAHLSFSTSEQAGSRAWVKRWAPHAHIVHDTRPFRELMVQLTAYFAGQLRTFTIPLDLRGTLFQSQVWQALLRIPYGQVQTYAHIARTIGRPHAARAVGAANGANPVSILVPCHRLVSSQSRLINYGGGVALKQQLLNLEGIILNDRLVTSYHGSLS